MQGAPQDRGVNFRALEDLFRLVAIRAPEADYEMHVSLVEVRTARVAVSMALHKCKSSLMQWRAARGSRS